MLQGAQTSYSMSLIPASIATISCATCNDNDNDDEDDDEC